MFQKVPESHWGEIISGEVDPGGTLKRFLLVALPIFIWLWLPLAALIGPMVLAPGLMVIVFVVHSYWSERDHIQLLVCQNGIAATSTYHSPSFYPWSAFAGYKVRLRPSAYAAQTWQLALISIDPVQTDGWAEFYIDPHPRIHERAWTHVTSHVHPIPEEVTISDTNPQMGDLVRL